jgi:hypothetical protein
MANADDNGGRKEFSLEALLRMLANAAKWQLSLRGCLDPIECSNDLAKDWTCFGRPVAGGQFLILGDKIVVFIPGAVDPENVLHRLVVFQVQEWKRHCERCRFGAVPIVEDFDNAGRPPLQLVDPADPIETLNAQLAFEEILAQIENPGTREMFALKFGEEWSEREIAAKLGLPLATVHQRIHRQIVKLRSIFVPLYYPVNKAKT